MSELLWQVRPCPSRLRASPRWKEGENPSGKIYNDVKMTIQNAQTYYKELIKEDFTHLRNEQHNHEGNSTAKCKVVLIGRNLGITL